MSGLSRLWHLVFLGNELGEWAVALAIFLVTITVLPLVKGAISRKQRREAEKQRQMSEARKIENQALTQAQWDSWFLQKLGVAPV